MSLFPCPDCGRELSPSATSCPNCGRPFTPCPFCSKALPQDAGRCPWCGNDPTAKPEKKTPKPIDPKTAYGCGTVIFILFLVFAISKCGGDGGKTTPPTQTTAGQTQRESVYNSSWDGSVAQVERWLKGNLKDPGSFEAIEWSPVTKVPPGSNLPHQYIVRCKYRAKNSFGGYVVEQKLFYLDAAGVVVSARDFPLRE